MKKRPFRCGLAMAALVLLGFFAPSLYWQIAGRVRGEAFYAGRPTSYWRGRILEEHTRNTHRNLVEFGFKRRTWTDVAGQAWDHWVAKDEPLYRTLACAGSLPVLRELLRDDDSRVREVAFYGAVCNSEQPTDLIPSLVDQLPESLEGASGLPPILTIPEAAPYLCRHLGGAGHKSYISFNCLMHIGADALPALSEALNSDSADTRLAATKVLAGIACEPKHRMLLEAMAADPDERVRSAAQPGLAQLQERLKSKSCPTPP